MKKRKYYLFDTAHISITFNVQLFTNSVLIPSLCRSKAFLITSSTVQHVMISPIAIFSNSSYIFLFVCFVYVYILSGELSHKYHTTLYNFLGPSGPLLPLPHRPNPGPTHTISAGRMRYKKGQGQKSPGRRARA